MFRFAPAKSATKFSLCTCALVSSILVTSFPSPGIASADPQLVQLESSRYATDETLPVDRLAVMAIALGSTVALGLTLNAVLARNNIVRRSRFRSSTKSSRSSSKDFSQAKRSLQRQLLRLLHEDQATANRLFQQATLKYPGQTSNWYVEKVIYDLERDRGRY